MPYKNVFNILYVPFQGIATGENDRDGKYFYLGWVEIGKIEVGNVLDEGDKNVVDITL